ncbi:MAG: AAA family ATPase, partial [Deltaproteobacteria bacterium]|nr:AAA family ATPase [Deltaproteobacteria bacterium]
MILATLELAQFRNIASANLSFGKGFNLLVGANAQGKTNILEAIALFAHGRSFRGADIHDMIRFGEGEARLQATTEAPQGNDSWKIILRDGKK